MRERRTARVILLDGAQRVLLLKGRLPGDPGAPAWWFTVGGGVEPGETLREAAKREILEETGFADAALGEVVFETEQVLHDRKGRPVRQHDTFLMARCAGGEPSRAGWQAMEREFVDDIRWWALDDLARCGEPIYPADLVQRLRAILSRGG